MGNRPVVETIQNFGDVMVLRVDQITINNLTFGLTNLGEQTTTETPWFVTRAKTKDVNNRLRITERYRQYDNLIEFVVNYTPNIRTLSDAQEAYSITYREKSWRIAEVYEHNDRQWVTLTCYRNEPTTAV